jgi:hypothetical protein
MMKKKFNEVLRDVDLLRSRATKENDPSSAIRAAEMLEKLASSGDVRAKVALLARAFDLRITWDSESGRTERCLEVLLDLINNATYSNVRERKVAMRHLASVLRRHESSLWPPLARDWFAELLRDPEVADLARGEFVLPDVKGEQKL